MRKFLACITASMILSASVSSGFAFDTIDSRGWSRTTGPTVMAYISLNIHPKSKQETSAYGLALTAPSWRSSGRRATLTVHAPKVFDLRFHGPRPDSLRIGNQLAWTQNPADLLGSGLRAAEGDGEYMLLWGILGAAALAGGIALLLNSDCLEGEFESGFVNAQFSCRQ
jgi:hypothetical protein